MVHFEFSRYVRILKVLSKKDVGIVYVGVDDPFAIHNNKVIFEIIAFVVVDYLLKLYMQFTLSSSSANH